jgi:hypothetical protein
MSPNVPKCPQMSPNVPKGPQTAPNGPNSAEHPPAVPNSGGSLERRSLAAAGMGAMCPAARRRAHSTGTAQAAARRPPPGVETAQGWPGHATAGAALRRHTARGPPGHATGAAAYTARAAGARHRARSVAAAWGMRGCGNSAGRRRRAHTTPQACDSTGPGATGLRHHLPCGQSGVPGPVRSDSTGKARPGHATGPTPCDSTGPAREGAPAVLCVATAHGPRAAGAPIRGPQHCDSTGAGFGRGWACPAGQRPQGPLDIRLQQVFPDVARVHRE